MRRHAVIISLDATFCADAGTLLSLPALGLLAQGGVFCKQMQTVYPTLTYPIHVSMLTGCYPDRHGIPHNQPFAPDEKPDMRAWYWDANQIQTPTLCDAVRAAGGDIASILWPVSGRSRAIRRNFPEVLPLPGENALLKMLRYGTAAWLLKTELMCGRQRKSIRQPDLDDYAVVLCRHIIKTRMPDLLCVHLVDCDAMRHRYGVHSEQASDALARLDRRVGDIIRAVKDAGAYDDTVFAVVSDHGQMDATRCLPIDAMMREMNIPARAQSIGMGAYIVPNSGANVEEITGKLWANREALGIARIFDRAALDALHAHKSVALAVDAEAGVSYVDAYGDTHKGDHGFAVDRPEAQCLLWLSGPGIRAGGTVERAHVTDIAPTLAKALGIPFDSAQGKAIQGVWTEESRA